MKDLKSPDNDDEDDEDDRLRGDKWKINSTYHPGLAGLEAYPHFQLNQVPNMRLVSVHISKEGLRSKKEGLRSKKKKRFKIRKEGLRSEKKV